MTGPATSRTRPPLRPLRGAEWFAARLALAIRRTRRFTRWWLGLGGAITVVALLLPVAAGDPLAETRETLDRAAADTLRIGARVRDMQQRTTEADSQLRVATGVQQRTRRAVTARAVAPPTAPRDPRLGSLDRAIAAARADQSVPTMLALADDPLLRYGPRMRAFADSLRRTTEPLEARRLGRTILEMAETRRAALAPQATRQARQAVELDEPVATDTAALRATLRALRDSSVRLLAAYRIATDSVAQLEQLLATRRSTVPPMSPGLIMLALLILGVALRVGSALTQEMREPTLAHGMEAERAVGAPALALVRDAIPDGPLRFRPSGVDPFRVLYLGLTATGTRARAVVVTGEDIVIAAAVAARLAIAAAADHRTTLVAELDPEQIALARIFRDHPEPGFTDAMAGTFKWKEVARPVGSSDGLTIQMVPAGTSRGAERDEAVEVEARASFSEFRNGFEFTILVIALHDLAQARELLAGEPLVLCGTLGETSVAQFTANGARAQEGSEKLHSVVIWDAPRPILPSRAELAAFLSKRKGCTPGGSFKAVQEAIKKPV
jgi:hypothetical protein